MTATTRKFALRFYSAIRHGMAYQNLEAIAYDERCR